jgi:cellulose synthase/poly-beta-1,6-N-acetylglucosamine synthase-like glycosyltransferase
MLWFWWIYGGALGLLMFAAAVDAYFGFKTVPDLNAAGFDVWPASPHPRITVVVPARNEEQAIESCLRSLAAQDYDALGVVAVDDRSTDATGEIMDGVAAQSGGRVRVIHVAELPARLAR